ncbi:MAG: GPW/gp25 family protein [Desulfamplus sp.]
MPAQKDFIGKGWKFPIQVDGQGRIALNGYEADISESIRIILQTSIGERRMRPNFGSRMNELMFDTYNPTFEGRAESYVREALAFWEPRIEVTAVDVAQDPDKNERVLITINYLIKSTNDERNLVFPFYVIPSEG